MALFAKTRNRIEIIGRNIPIPFSEIASAVSPDTVSARYTNNPNSIKFDIIFNLLITNCLFLFLYPIIATTVRAVDNPNRIVDEGIIMK